MLFEFNVFFMAPEYLEVNGTVYDVDLFFCWGVGPHQL